MSYPHLQLRAWPFRVVPEPQFCDFLADRKAVKADVEALLRSLESRPTSTIHLMWSWYGAGKTHTAFYLANRCKAMHPALSPFYTECPRDARGFQDLYRVTVAQLPIQDVITAFLDLSTGPSTGDFRRALDPDLSSALTQAALGERPLQVLLQQWLIGNSIPRKSMTQLGVGARIGTAEQCSLILADLILLLTGCAGRGKRIIWIVDEIQRAEELPGSPQRSLLSGLVGVFNRCPTGLTLLLAYSGEPRPKGLPEWIPSDLADRIGLEKTMLLPPLLSDEGRAFVRDLLAHFRPPGVTPQSDYFPFEPAAVEALVDALASHGDLKPRTLMQYLDNVLRIVEPRLRAGDRNPISLAELKLALRDQAITWPAQRAKAGKGS